MKLKRQVQVQIYPVGSYTLPYEMSGTDSAWEVFAPVVYPAVIYCDFKCKNRRSPYTLYQE
eukprot:884941-Rhodomonas_salina.3